MRISVIGLGYVGSVISACMADQSHQIICYDIDNEKRSAIRSGKSPIVEPGLQGLIEKHIQSGNLIVSDSIEDSLLQSDISLISVGTPANSDGSIDLSQILSACGQIGEAIKKKRTFHTVVIRSTILPGTSEDFLIPCIEQASGKKMNEDFAFLVNPEFLREGSAIEDYFNPPKIVVGVCDGNASVMNDLYKTIDCPKITTSLKNAEAIKYVDNSWHALKVCFANEIGAILKEHRIDSHEVMNIFALDRKLNISNAYLKPGFSFGGSCLPKDVRALSARAHQTGLKVPVLDSLMTSNEVPISRALDMIDSCKRQKILLLGIAFKSSTDDLRSSPLLTLAYLLQDRGYNLSIYDPNVTVKSFPLMNSMTEDIKLAAAEAEIIVIGNSNETFLPLIDAAPKDCFIIDLARLNHETMRERKNYAGICW